MLGSWLADQGGRQNFCRRCVQKGENEKFALLSNHVPEPVRYVKLHINSISFAIHILCLPDSHKRVASGADTAYIFTGDDTAIASVDYAGPRP